MCQVFSHLMLVIDDLELYEQQVGGDRCGAPNCDSLPAALGNSACASSQCLIGIWNK